MRRLPIPEFTTISYGESETGVATVTLNRPDRLNAFDATMQRELHQLWRLLRRHDPVKAIVLTGAGDRAFCTGIDRHEQMGGGLDEQVDIEMVGDGGVTPFMFNDPGELLGPKAADLWKPVIAAVNGMACGGAFYMLGEVEFILAAEHATFFDPHVTFGMTAAYEPMHLSGLMPFGEIMRMSLLGSHERISAATAQQMGLVSEVTSKEGLLPRAQELAERIAAQPRLAIEGTVRSIWAARELGGRQALRQGYAFVGLGTNEASLAEGQRRFESGERIEYETR